MRLVEGDLGEGYSTLLTTYKIVSKLERVLGTKQPSRFDDAGGTVPSIFQSLAKSKYGVVTITPKPA